MKKTKYNIDDRFLAVEDSTDFYITIVEIMPLNGVIFYNTKVDTFDSVTKNFDGSFYNMEDENSLDELIYLGKARLQ